MQRQHQLAQRLYRHTLAARFYISQELYRDVGRLGQLFAGKRLLLPQSAQALPDLPVDSRIKSHEKTTFFSTISYYYYRYSNRENQERKIAIAIDNVKQ